MLQIVFAFKDVEFRRLKEFLENDKICYTLIIHLLPNFLKKYFFNKIINQSKIKFYK